MRAPERIEPLLALVRAIWTRNPGLRLGQLIGNCTPGDAYFLEDDVLERRLRELYGAEARP